MSKLHCSVPDILDSLNCQDKVKIIQTYSCNKDIDDLPNVAGKIIVLLYLGEYHYWKWVDELLVKIKNNFLHTGKIKNYYIILSVHQYPQSLFQEYSNFFTFIYEPRLYGYYVEHFEKIKFTKNIKYHFLSLNNRASLSRHSLYYFFYKFSLIEKSHFSYLGDLSRTEYSNYNDLLKNLTQENLPWYLKNLNFDYLNNKIPIKIPGDNFADNDWTIGQTNYYSESFCSVVLETYDDQPYAFLTEKTWKPIAFGHPFIIYSNPNLLEVLKDLGFQTFSNFWDESYDNYSGNKRLEAIFHLLLEISGWSIDKLNLINSKISNIIEHNRNHFFNQFYNEYKNLKQPLNDKINNSIKLNLNRLE